MAKYAIIYSDTVKNVHTFNEIFDIINSVHTYNIDIKIQWYE